MTPVRILLLSAVLLSSCASPGDGGSARSSHAHTLGTARTADGSASCSIGLSAPSGSALKNQQINFVLSRASYGTPQEFPISTGSSRTLAQLQAQLASALTRGLNAPADTELLKVGDIKYGGEVRLTARGVGAVSFDYLPAVEGGNPTLSAGETEAFRSLLSR